MSENSHKHHKIKLSASSIYFKMAIILLTILGPLQSLYCQIPKSVNTRPTDTRTNNDIAEFEGPDTTIYNYVLIDDIFKTYVIDDSLANIAFLHKDPMWKDGNELINTGNRGSATYPLLYRTKINTGFNSGYNQYDAYKLSLGDFKFYEQNRPIADLYFSQLADQQNISVGAEFSRNFSDGLSFSLNYKRWSQKGFFANQDTKTTNFGAGLRYKSKSEIYNGIFIFIQNANEENHNGGILNLDDLGAQFLSNIPTVLSESRTRHQEQTYSYIQFYNITSVKNDQWKVYLRNDIIYKPAYYNFGDNNINDTSDSLFYGDLAIDSRGIRRNLAINHFKNAFYVYGEKVKGISSKAGIIYDRYNIVNISDTTRNDLTLSYDGRLPLFDKFFIDVYGRLGVLKNAGNFDIGGNLELQPTKSIIINSGIKFFISEQNYNAQILNINDQIIFKNEFRKSIGSVIYGELLLPKFKFKASVSQSVINQSVYWDKNGKPSQYDGVLSVSNISLSQNIKLWKIHLDNQFHTQFFSDQIFPLPKFYSTHQFYFASSAFKKTMDVNIGLDLRIINDYNGGIYQPVYGVYHLSDTNLPFFPAANLYVIAKISEFRAILMMENFSQVFRKDNNFDAVNHPQFGSKFRFTVQWLLKD